MSHMIKPRCRYCGRTVKNFGDVCKDDQETTTFPLTRRPCNDEATRCGATHRDAMEAVTY